MAEPLPAPRRILVAHDFSPCADAAGRAAARDLLCSRDGGTIVLCHVFEPMQLPESAIEGTDGTQIVSMERAVAMEVTNKLERAAGELRRAIEGMRRDDDDPPVVEVEVVVRQDSPAEGIVALSREQETSRIVVGSHGRRGLAHFFLGSVAERVARTARVPVLVVNDATP
jgi:nucleotide-binding universal stress UspA family protein